MIIFNLHDKKQCIEQTLWPLNTETLQFWGYFAVWECVCKYLYVCPANIRQYTNKTSHFMLPVLALRDEKAELKSGFKFVPEHTYIPHSWLTIRRFRLSSLELLTLTWHSLKSLFSQIVSSRSAHCSDLLTDSTGITKSMIRD